MRRKRRTRRRNMRWRTMVITIKMMMVTTTIKLSLDWDVKLPPALNWSRSQRLPLRSQQSAYHAFLPLTSCM